MITWFCSWWMQDILSNTYDKGWKDGVDQQRLDPETTEWYVTPEY